jgi:hypothetical protein
MAKSKYVTFEDLVRFHREVIAPDLDRRMDGRLSPIIRHLLALDEKMDAMRDELKGDIAVTRNQMLTNFDGVYAKLDLLAVEFDATKGGLRRVEERLATLEKQIS